MTEIEIATNKDLFLSILREKCPDRPGLSNLLSWLEEKTDFFTAPCSTRFHLSEAGGLCAHSLNVYYRLRALFLSEKQRSEGDDATLTVEEDDTVAFVSLLHDVCKCNVYHPIYRNQKTYDAAKVAAAEPYQVKEDPNGRFVWETVPGFAYEENFPFGHGEKSVFIINRCVKLSVDEALAIRWHMGFSDVDFKAGGYNVGAAFERCPLALLLHMADLQATYLDESRNS